MLDSRPNRPHDGSEMCCFLQLHSNILHGRPSVAHSMFLHCRLGYPCMVRPSYVLGGRAMEIVYSDKDLKRYIQNAVEVCS